MTRTRASFWLSAPLLVFLLSCNQSRPFSVEQLQNPTGAGSLTPNLTQMPDGQVMLSWLEPMEGGLALRFAMRGEHGWSAPQTVVARKNFAKYAEAPSWVLMLPDGVLIAVWAEELAGGGKWPGNYLYSAASLDRGKSWSSPAIVHSDRTNAEHSFASVAVLDERHASIVWLDARDYASKHRYRLMSAVISSSGSISDEETLDDDVCTCCPTALARTSTGLIAAYRDHSSEEIRDIYSVRRESGHWQASQAVYRDGWHINACPVNGPALASHGNAVVAAWYTGAGEKGVVRVAFSSDGGASFANPVTIDAESGNHKPMGRPALTLLKSGDALVAWTRHQEDHGELVAVRVRRDAEAGVPLIIASGATQTLGYPRIQSLESGALLSWGAAADTKSISTSLITLR